MNTVLDLQLNLHQEIEFLEKEAVKELVRRSKLQKERLIQEHCVNYYLEGIRERSIKLQALYTDKNGNLRSELSAMAGPSKLSEFYSRLRAIKDHHRRHPNARVESIDSELRLKKRKEEIGNELEVMFSGDENYGRYIDLNEVFDLYINLENVPKVNSLKFLNVIDQFHEIPISAKKHPNYGKRQNPLFDFELLKKNTEDKFELDWENKSVQGWFSDKVEDKIILCSTCNKVFSNQNVYNHHLKGGPHKKAERLLNEKKLRPPAKKVKEEHYWSFKELASMEEIIKAYLDKLLTIREDTVLRAERKQTLTTDELMADAVEEAEIDESEEEDERLYNPLKLPLGWDGKPIPYWLYKLHGLGVEYPCEICGNYVYMGRKAFDRHFQEWRHAHGMRCLGITNTRHFQEITLIQDAYALWEKLEHNIKKEKTSLDAMEEFEDSEGNVFNKKTYEDLKRQGLI